MEDYQQVGGHRVKVIEEGHGPPLIFFYDSWHTALGAGPVTEHLSRRFKVIAVDPPGFGSSPLSKDLHLTLSDYATFVAKLVEHTGPGNVTLVLTGIGEALALAAFQQEESMAARVGRVVLLNGFLYGAHAGFRPFKATPLFSRWDLPMNRMVHRRKILQLYGEPSAMDETTAERGWSSFPGGLYSTQFKLANELAQSETTLAAGRRALADSGSPIMLLWGEDDPSGGRAVAERAEQEFPDAEIYLLPHVGHFPHLEAVEVVAEAISGFAARGARVTTSAPKPPPEEKPAGES